jgi:short-subunit dehydrogenase
MHVAVTGASAGIGEAIAREFGAAGAKLSLVARRKERLDAIARDVAQPTRVFQRDLSDVEAATDWLAEAEAALGPIDVLVNNAGVQIIEPAHTIDPARGEHLLRVDLHTPLRLTRAVLPAMIARGSGCIVDVASMAALAPMPGMLYYNAAKAALGAASEALRGELRGTGVHVVTVYPGPVDTDMGQRGYDRYEPTLAARLSPVGNTAELARMVRRAVERRRARIIYPRAYAVARWFPNLSRWFTLRFAPKMKPLLPPSPGAP